MSDRERFTAAQLQQYFDHTCLANELRTFDVSKLLAHDQLAYLRLLLKHHLVKVPWENLSQHYSWHRTINVNPQHLFRKVVSSTKHFATAQSIGLYCHGTYRGGYCMEANTFLQTILFSIGYDVFIAGARVWQGDHYGGFTHCVNIVTIAGQQWMVDVGFGANGPVSPIPLSSSGEDMTHIEPAKMRVLHEPIAQNLDQNQKTWVYQHRISDLENWVPIYCFVNFEFIPQDIQAMNRTPWQSPNTFFTHKVICCRFTTAAEKDAWENGNDARLGSASEEALSKSEIDGQLFIDNHVLKWRRQGRMVREIRFKSDGERIQALRRYFGIELLEEDMIAIRGSAAEVTGKEFSIS